MKYQAGAALLATLRPTGRKDAEPPIDDNPAKELQAAPLQVPAGCCYDGAQPSRVGGTTNTAV
jgi:hypothetical protein